MQEQTLKCCLHGGHSAPLHSRRCITVGNHKYSSALKCSLPASTSTLLLLSQLTKCESPHSSLPVSLSLSQPSCHFLVQPTDKDSFVIRFSFLNSNPIFHLSKLLKSTSCQQLDFSLIFLDCLFVFSQQEAPAH